MSRVVFVPDPSYSSQSGVNTQLDTTHAASKITLLVTQGLSPADQFAHIWAQANGVPWIARNAYLNAAGFVQPAPRALAGMQVSNPDTVITAGTGAHVSAAVAAATKRGHTLTQL